MAVNYNIIPHKIDLFLCFFQFIIKNKTSFPRIKNE